ncbi:DUF4226 domain-containing protein [Mycobacterium sp. 1423905.2]|uniref:DUF4226 domain-containing protein n=1 Tax=Mycobacterium sp. 1423905.2 TaxID=1856859 RepID=UPI0007FC6D52|nr:DUF4226 domain-containing protein [Mycobacterium sp. 1423905.2]OBJ50854.1 hypothetical protein A9W95_22685 [Mycobacterium sp. 1423905.2]
MSDQAGSSIATIQARQAALARRHRAVAEADRVLTEAVHSAHAAMRDSVQRLDAIAAEIGRAVPDEHERAVDTPVGARELQRFLVAKQREIATIVADARELSRTKAAVLQGIKDHYILIAG